MTVSLRKKLIFWFLTFTALSFVLVIPFNIIYFNKREKISSIVNEVQLLNLSLLKNRNLENEIYTIDTKNSAFFLNHNSENLIKLKKEKLKLYKTIEKLEKSKFISNHVIDKDIKEIHRLVTLSDKCSDKILSSIFAIGFKNEGIVGEMRKSIHAIEEIVNIDKESVLMLRRHEKDYMLRSEKEYISKLNNLVDKFKQEIQKDTRYSNKKRQEILSLLANYKENFNKMVILDKISGLKNYTGLKQKQDECFHQIATIQQNIIVKAEAEKAELFRNLEIIYILFFCILMIMALLLCLYISKIIANPLKELTSYILKMKRENLKFDKIPEIKQNYTEAKVLTYEFCQMFFQLEQREEEHHKYVEQLIEARKKAEISDKLKTSFLANMSHEIRTPMNAIIGFSSLLELDSKSEESKNEYIKHIQNSGKHLLKLIDDIIDIAKIEAGEVVIENKAMNINSLMDELLIYFSYLNKKNIKLIVSNYFECSHSAILADESRLRQIMINLINNAMKFTHTGSIEFGYICTGKYLQFYVKDTGIGIPENMQQTIFERFRQVDHNHKYYGGAGLGLTITQNLLKLMGGHIWLVSEVNQGSTFYFTLPYILAESNIYSSKNVFIEN